MRGFLIVLIGGGSFFLGGLFTMAISDLIVKPFGLHGYTYGQALAVDFMVTLSLLVAMVVVGAINWLAD